MCLKVKKSDASPSSNDSPLFFILIHKMTISNYHSRKEKEKETKKKNDNLKSFISFKCRKTDLFDCSFWRFNGAISINAMKWFNNVVVENLKWTETSNFIKNGTNPNTFVHSRRNCHFKRNYFGGTSTKMPKKTRYSNSSFPCIEMEPNNHLLPHLSQSDSITLS